MSSIKRRKLTLIATWSTQSLQGYSTAKPVADRLLTKRLFLGLRENLTVYFVLDRHKTSNKYRIGVTTGAGRSSGSIFQTINCKPIGISNQKTYRLFMERRYSPNSYLIVRPLNVLRVDIDLRSSLPFPFREFLQTLSPCCILIPPTSPLAVPSEP